MSGSTTGIQWTQRTWNPVVGCTPVSRGCLNCYAAGMAMRLRGIGMRGYTDVTVDRRGTRAEISHRLPIAEMRGGRAVFTGSVRLVEEALAAPLKRQKPTLWFVNSMSDLFHEDVPDWYIRVVFAVMSFCGQHTFQVLTKRPKRMADWLACNTLSECQAEYCVRMAERDPAVTPGNRSRIRDTRAINGTRKALGDGNYWPLPNVWLGASVEDQTAAEDRIPEVLRCPAAVRFLSCEPLLNPVDLSAFFGGAYVALPGDRVERNYNFGVDWVIVGGESGPKARQCYALWIADIVRQCKRAKVPVFVKQLGAQPMLGDVGDLHGWPARNGSVDWETGRICLKDSHGADMAEWPEHLRVREMPSGAVHPTSDIRHPTSNKLGGC